MPPPRSGRRLEDAYLAATAARLMGLGIKAKREHDPDEDLKHAFSLFDLDRDGYISQQEMTTALAQLGVPLNEKEVGGM